MENAPLRIGKAAQMLGVHPDTLRRWLREGTLPSVPYGWERRVRPSDIEHVLRYGKDAA